jgi:hypothetical protein
VCYPTRVIFYGKFTFVSMNVEQAEVKAQRCRRGD